MRVGILNTPVVAWRASRGCCKPAGLDDRLVRGFIEPRGPKACIPCSPSCLGACRLRLWPGRGICHICDPDLPDGYIAGTR